MVVGMRVAFVLASMMLGLSVSEPSCDCDKDPKALVEYALQEKQTLIKRWSDRCVEERKETKEWMDSVDPKAADAARDARMADKKALSGALEDRIGGLQKFIEELKKIRTQLGSHIARVNKVYADKYQANLNDQTAASATLHDLSLDFAAPHNVKLNPIQQVKNWKLNAPDEGSDSSDPAVFLSVEELDRREGAQLDIVRQKVESRVSLCKETGCSAAYRSAFELYQLGWKNNQRVRDMFKKENSTLGEFRRKLAGLIKKKTAKMSKLNAQLANLNKAMANPDPPLSELFPLIGKHYVAFTKICTNFAQTSAEGQQALQAMLQVLAEPTEDGAVQTVPASSSRVSAASTTPTPTTIDVSQPVSV